MFTWSKMCQPAWRKKGRKRREREEHESGEEGRKHLLQQPVFFYSAHYFLNYPLSPITFHFSLPPYPLPISTTATQARGVYINQFVKITIYSLCTAPAPPSLLRGGGVCAQAKLSINFSQDFEPFFVEKIPLG